MYHSVHGTSNIGKVLSFIKWKNESESVSGSIKCDSATSWTVVSQALLSMEFSRQEYWNGLPFPSPGDVPDPGIGPGPPALQADSWPSGPPGRPPFIKWNGAHNKKLGRESLSDKNWKSFHTSPSPKKFRNSSRILHCTPCFNFYSVSGFVILYSKFALLYYFPIFCKVFCSESGNHKWIHLAIIKR